MDRKNLGNVEMIARVVEFGATHVDLFPKNTLAGQAFAALGSALSKVSDQASLQVSGKNAVRSSAKIRAAAREALRLQLQRISETAIAVSIDRPGIEGKFRMPDRRRDQAMIHGGKAFANEAEPLKKEFIQHRLPNNFIDNLNAAVADLERAMLEQASSKRSRANATKAIDDAMNDCLTLLQRVDAVVINTLGDQPPLMAEWNITRRAGRTPARPTAPESAPESAPAAS